MHNEWKGEDEVLAKRPMSLANHIPVPSIRSWLISELSNCCAITVQLEFTNSKLSCVRSWSFLCLLMFTAPLISFSVTDATTPKWQFLYFHWQVSRSFSFGHPSRGNSAEDVFPKLDLSVVIIADEQIRGNNNALLFPGWRAKWDDEWLIKRKWAFVNILSDN